MMNEMLHKLEDRVINLVDELESLRARLNAALQENHELKAEVQSLRGRTESEQEKLRGILSLLDGVEKAEAQAESAHA